MCRGEACGREREADGRRVGYIQAIRFEDRVFGWIVRGLGIPIVFGMPIWDRERGSEAFVLYPDFPFRPREKH